LPDKPAAVRLTQSTVVPIAALRSGFSPRLAGVDEQHAQLLAEAPGDLPSILVQHRTMRIIDGMHRLRAACLQGKTEVLVEFVDDDDDAAFLRAVTANLAHGLPLTLGDRKSAASRIMEIRPDWSDRAVAQAAGISSNTAASLRRADHTAARVSVRRGRDGRMRPVQPAAGRKRARDLLLARPEATLREIAIAAGVSPSTVSDVRDRMRRGDDSISTRRPTTAASTGKKRKTAQGRSGTDDDRNSTMAKLARDPSLRYTDTGRLVLAWLQPDLNPNPDSKLIEALPAHCLPHIAELSHQTALRWKQFAQLAEQHVEDH
jgi:ParB-like chromosome segregation protein Spo0J